MSSPNARENIIIKKKYMSRRFGVFKSCILRCLQRKTFLETISKYDNILNRCGPGINSFKTNALKVITNGYLELYYLNTDLWVDDITKTESFSRNTQHILYQKNHNIINPVQYFYKHLSRLGFLCRGIDDNICDVKCDEYLCDAHLQFRHNCISEIKLNCYNCNIPDVLIQLTIEYTFTFY
jgi:hypothetical protein